MKVLIATFTFPPNKDGVSESASAMARAFYARGWEVEIATEPTLPPRQEKSWEGIGIREFSISGSPHTRYPFRGETGAYREFLLAGAWDVLIFHAYTWPTYLAIPLLDEIPGKKVLVSHGYGALVWVPSRRFPFGFASLLDSLFRSILMLGWLRKFDRVVYLSPRRDLGAFFDHALACLLRHRGIRVIPNGIDPVTRGHRDAFRQFIGVTPGEIVFLCVANYSRRKDQGYAARAFRRAAIPKSVLVFIGSEFNESYRGFRAADAPWESASPPGRIVWLEKQDRVTTLNALAGCDVFILSASVEAHPIALLEAMREEKPWIARKAGCIAEMAGGLCVNSEKAMALAMRKLAGDSGQRTELGRKGALAMKRENTLAGYADSYCDLLEELVPLNDQEKS
jgi:glycosyltransferase involved in cell wall biosynthesis